MTERKSRWPCRKFLGRDKAPMTTQAMLTDWDIDELESWCEGTIDEDFLPVLRQVCNVARAHLSAGWQPIETAPKDGTKILGFGEPYGEDGPIGIIWWHQEAHEYYEQTDADTKKRVVEDASRWEGAWIWPTNWMPLPPPPSMAAQSEEGKEDGSSMETGRPISRSTRSPAQDPSEWPEGYAPDPNCPLPGMWAPRQERAASMQIDKRTKAETVPTKGQQMVVQITPPSGEEQKEDETDDTTRQRPLLEPEGKEQVLADDASAVPSDSAGGIGAGRSSDVAIRPDERVAPHEVAAIVKGPSGEEHELTETPKPSPDIEGMVERLLAIQERGWFVSTDTIHLEAVAALKRLEVDQIELHVLRDRDGELRARITELEGALVEILKTSDVDIATMCRKRRCSLRFALIARAALKGEKE